MRKLGNSLKTIMVLLNFLVSLGIVWGTSLVGAEETPSSSEIVLPAGARLIIPEAIMQQYQQEADLWGRPFNYLSYHYSYVGPSLREGKERESTYYFPLSRENGEEIGGKSLILVDFMNLQQINKEKGIFSTLEDIPIKHIHMLYDYYCDYLLPIRVSYKEDLIRCQGE